MEPQQPRFLFLRDLLCYFFHSLLPRWAVEEGPSRGALPMRRYKRSTRVADLVRMEVADIIQNRLKDPRVGFVTVTDVKLSDDLKNGTVYMSVLDKAAHEETLKVINASAGFIRTELGHRLRLRFIPKLIFRIDECVERGARIDALLRGIQGDDEGTA